MIEDFTGSQEVLCWGESYTPARDAGILEEGKVIALKGEVTIDDRTESRKIMGSGLKELKLRANPNGSNGGGPLELSLWVSRSRVENFQSGTGKRATVECGEQFRIQKSEALSAALGRWVD